MPELDHTASREFAIAMTLFAQQMGLWVDEIIRTRHPRWLTKIGEHNVWWSRLFALLFVKLNGYRVSQRRHHTMVGGKGFRKGAMQTRLSAIECELLRWGKPVAERRFPINVNIG